MCGSKKTDNRKSVLTPIIFCPLPSAAHEQGPYNTTRPLCDHRQHILATVHRDAAALWYCSETP